MRTRRGITWVAALLLLAAPPLQAAPRVVVSNPNLHSLVTTLMEGVAEPELLADSEPARLIGADMVVWVGPAAEADLAASLARLSRARERTVTVARYVPRLAQGEGADFLLDPRLASMAVRYITPQLVEMDPEHYARYLDNELRLRERLKALEADLAARFAPYRGRRVAGRFSPHLSHRLGVVASGAGAVKAALTATPLPAPGADHYFERVRARAEALQRACERLHTASR